MPPFATRQFIDPGKLCDVGSLAKRRAVIGKGGSRDPLDGPVHAFPSLHQSRQVCSWIGREGFGAPSRAPILVKLAPTSKGVLHSLIQPLALASCAAEDRLGAAARWCALPQVTPPHSDREDCDRAVRPSPQDAPTALAKGLIFQDTTRGRGAVSACGSRRCRHRPRCLTPSSLRE